MKDFENIPDPDQDVIKAPIQIDVYGVKLKTEATLRKVHAEQRPQSLNEVGERVKGHLLSIAENCFAAPAYALEMVSNVFRSMNAGLTSLGNYWAPKVSDAHTEADRIEEERQSLLEHAQQPKLPGPNAVETAKSELTELIESLQAKGITVQIGKLRNGQVGMVVVQPELAEVSFKLIERNYEPSDQSVEGLAAVFTGGVVAHAVATASEFKDYSVDIKHHEGVLACQVTFRSLPGHADIAEKTVRAEMQKVIEVNANVEILGMAFNAEGKSLPDESYGGPLLYKPSDQHVMNMDKRRGLNVIEADRRDYFVRIEDGRTAEGINPANHWYTVSIVFPGPPRKDLIRASIQNEIATLVSQKRDISAYVFQGDKSNKITWAQVHAPNGM